MANLSELIERLEKAAGPDHELDCDIYHLWRKTAPAPLGGGIWTTDMEYAPAYTSSLDAALTLVPEGWCWRYDSSTFDAEVSDYSGRFLIEADKECHGANKNPAIAICIAALRARAALPQT